MAVGVENNLFQTRNARRTYDLLLCNCAAALREAVHRPFTCIPFCDTLKATEKNAAVLTSCKARGIKAYPPYSFYRTLNLRR